MTDLKKEYQLPVYLFHEGKNYRAYEFFGVHKVKRDTFVFRVWAPHAKALSVVGDFNNWDIDANYMEQISPGIWEAQISGVKIYDCYKYAILTQSNTVIMLRCRYRNINRRLSAASMHEALKATERHECIL